MLIWLEIQGHLVRKESIKHISCIEFEGSEDTYSFILSSIDLYLKVQGKKEKLESMRKQLISVLGGGNGLTQVIE